MAGSCASIEWIWYASLFMYFLGIAVGYWEGTKRRKER